MFDLIKMNVRKSFKYTKKKKITLRTIAGRT